MRGDSLTLQSVISITTTVSFIKQIYLGSPVHFRNSRGNLPVQVFYLIHEKPSLPFCLEGLQYPVVVHREVSNSVPDDINFIPVSGILHGYKRNRSTQNLGHIRQKNAYVRRMTTRGERADIGGDGTLTSQTSTSR
jgi:hypothetical protein